jgi:hypothetical protein
MGDMELTWKTFSRSVVELALFLTAGALVRAEETKPSETIYQLPRLSVSPFEGKISIFIGYEPKVAGTEMKPDKNGTMKRVPVTKLFVKYVEIKSLEPGSVREARIENGSFIVDCEGHHLPGRPKEGFIDFLRGIRVPAGSDFILGILPPRRPGQRMDDALSGKPTVVKIPTTRDKAKTDSATAKN